MLTLWLLQCFSGRGLGWDTKPITQSDPGCMHVQGFNISSFPPRPHPHTTTSVDLYFVYLLSSAKQPPSSTSSDR